MGSKRWKGCQDPVFKAYNKAQSKLKRANERRIRDMYERELRQNATAGNACGTTAGNAAATAAAAAGGTAGADDAITISSEEDDDDDDDDEGDEDDSQD